MSLRTRFVVLLCVGILWAALAGVSQAQGRGGFLGMGGMGYGGYGGWWTGMPYGFAQNQQELPYFSKYPPVYYSYPVARTYGYSPFAYPPGYTTPDAQETPVEIINPHVPPQEVKPTSDQTTAARQPTPKVVLNPYVDQVQLSVDP